MNKDINIMISPFSIYQALSILANGAVEETQKEILEVLFPDKDISDNNYTLTQLNTNFIKILNELSAEDFVEPSTTTLKIENTTNTKKNLSSNLDDIFFPEIEHIIIGENKNKKDNERNNNSLIFNNVNALFIDEKFEILEQFLLTCDNYNISVKELIDAQQINDFCYNNTNGKITKIIDKIPNGIAFILINAIYFKGNWSFPFKKENTKKLPFENVNKKKVKIDTMYKYFEDIYYYEDDKIQMISLPYSSKKLNFRMIILLPNSEIYSSSLNYLTSEKIDLNILITKLKKRENVHLYLPKFKSEFSQVLNDTLKEMNMKKAFNPYEAQFNGMTFQRIYIGDILHKTFIQVDEEGTEAAAVTAVFGLFGSAPKEPKEYYMNVNHSFIYMIVSDEIKDSEGNFLIPFVGVVNNLAEEIIEEENNIDKKNNTDKNTYDYNITEKNSSSIKENRNQTENLEDNIKNENDNLNNSIKYTQNNTISKEINMLNNISSDKSYNIKLNKIIIFLSVIATIIFI